MIGKKNRLVGAILLVAGTTIGAGMLALPLTTGRAGLFPALILMTLIWLYMMLPAFYLLEVNLRMPGESNIISMMHKTLGRPGEVVTWIVYLLLLYSLVAAYMVGTSDLIANLVGLDLPAWVWTLGIFVLFGLFVYLGTQSVDMFNRILMAGLFIGFVVVIGVGIFRIQGPLLVHHDWNFLIASTSVMMTTFGYHIIIPTLTTYLEHDTKLLKWAIFVGSLIPFVCYVLWQVLVMGLLPVETLEEAASEGRQVVFYLKQALGAPWLGLVGKVFAFFVIMTSLLGVSISLSDFLADGLKIEKSRLGRVGIVLLTFIPPLIFALFYPRGFILALRFAGIFVVILLAAIPALMAWYERYGPETERSFLKSEFQVPGGKFGVIATFIIALVLLGIEVVA